MDDRGIAAGADPLGRVGSPPSSGAERARRWGVLLLPLALYVPLIPPGLTFGDGPELLTAILTWGVAHPSGYPLYTLLGQLPARLPFGTPHFNVALAVSAVPAAVACRLLYATLRRLAVGPAWAVVTALAFALNGAMLKLATRVEVYALHALLQALTLYALVRLDERPAERRWVFLTAAALALGLTNHLTTVLLLPPAVLGLLLIARRAVLRPRTIAKILAIGLGVGLLYLYLPLQAAANTGDRITWGDPQTLGRFWSHVTGAEYRHFRHPGALAAGLEGVAGALRADLFPGVVLVSLLGLVEGLRRRRRIALPVVLFALLQLVYVAAYDIEDIDTYYPGLYLPVLVLAGLGADWLVAARLPETGWVRRAIVAAAALWVGTLWWSHRDLRYRDGLAQAMSAQVVAGLPAHAVVFTTGDAHTFPLWYEAYVVHPDRDLVVLDVDMFSRSEKQWYRETLRRRHPDVHWPSDAEALLRRRRWVPRFIRLNAPRYAFAALLDAPWDIPGSYAVNAGWAVRVLPERPGLLTAPTRHVKHIYTARLAHLSGGEHMHDSATRYPAGVADVACVVEWWPARTASCDLEWVFSGPGGVVHRLPGGHVPIDYVRSWAVLPAASQVPGAWECTAEIRGEVPVTTRFDLTGPGAGESPPE